MAWEELTDEEAKAAAGANQPEGDQPWALPVPDKAGMKNLQRSLFNDVEQAFKDDPDPRFSSLNFVPPKGSGDATTTPPAEAKWEPLEDLDMPETPPTPEDPNLWERAVDFTSRSVIEQLAGGAKEFGQRFALESAVDKGKDLQKVRALDGAPEGEAAYFGAKSIKDVFTNPWKSLNFGEQILKTGLSASDEGRGVLEQQLKDEMQQKLDQAKQYAQEAGDRPFSKATQQFLNPNSENTAWDDFMADPATIVAELGVRSLPNMAPGLALGAAGGAAGGLPGFAAGMGAGSARIEYAATLMGELQKMQGVDIYNAEDLYKVITNEELMDEIHQKAVTRASRVGTTDGVAAALAGTVIIKKLGGPIVTKMTEAATQLGSQGALGGLGEALAMEASGEAESLGEALMTRDVYAEVAGEAVTAPIDVAAATLSGAREARDARLFDIPETEVDEDGEVKIRIDPEVDQSVEQETKAPAFETTNEGISEAEAAALNEALDDQAAAETTTPPQEGQAPTPPLTPSQAAEPTPVGESTQDEVVTGDDLVTEPVDEEVTAPVDEEVTAPVDEEVTAPVDEEVTAPVDEEVTTTSPMIDKKEVKKGFSELAKRSKSGMKGLRAPLRELGTAVQALFPEVQLPSLKNRIGAQRLSEFFSTLDEQVVIEEQLPNLKGFLDELFASADTATAVQNINRLKDYVANSGAGVLEGGVQSTGQFSPAVEQAARAVTAFDTFEAERKSGEKPYQRTDTKKGSKTFGKKIPATRNTSPKNRLTRRIVAIDELATAVASLIDGNSEVSAEVTDTIRTVRRWRDAAQTSKTRITKGGAGSSSTSYGFTGAQLDEAQTILRDAAKTLAGTNTGTKPINVSTSSEKSTAPKKGKGKAKAETSTPVTEAPAKPKKAQKAKDAPAAPEVKAAKPEKTAKPKKAAKPKKPKVDPEKVAEDSDLSAPITGKRAQLLAERAGVETGPGSVDRALEQLGLPKKTAGKLKALYNLADDDGKKLMLDAINRYRGPDDNANLLAAVSKATGREPNWKDMGDILQFMEKAAENRQLRDLDSSNLSVSEEAIAAEAEAQGYSLEDWKEILRATGQFVEEQDAPETPWSDPYQDMSQDEWENSQWIGADSLPQGVRRENKDLFAGLINSKKGFLRFLSDFTKRRGLPDPGPTNVNDLLDAIIEALPSNNRFVPLAKRLRSLELDVPVYIYDEAPVNEEGNSPMGTYYPGNDYNPDDRRIRLYVDKKFDPRHIFHTALHEVVHAATIAAYETDPKFRSELDAMYDRAALELDRIYPQWRADGKNPFYGMTNPKEFIAEALTNRSFQRFLSSIDSINPQRAGALNKLKGMMRDFVNVLKKQFGYSIRNSLLEDVIILAEENLQNEFEVTIAQQKAQIQSRRASETAREEDAQPSGVSAANDVLDTTKVFNKNIASNFKKVYDAVSEKGRSGFIGWASRDQIERQYRSLFDKAAAAMKMANPMSAYVKAKNSASALARSYEKQAYALFKKIQKLDNLSVSKMQVVMRDVTLSNIDPTQPLNSEANRHIWTKGGKKKPPQIKKKYKEIAKKARSNWIQFERDHPKTAKITAEMAALSKKIYETKVSSALFALGEKFEFDSSTTQAIQKAKTAEDIDKIIPPNEVEVLEGQIERAKNKKDKKALEKVLKQAESREEAAKRAKQILNETSIKGWYFPLRRFGNYVVSTADQLDSDDAYVSFHESKEHAKAVRDALQEKFPDKEFSLTLKLENSAPIGDIESVVADLSTRIQDRDTRARMNSALVEVLAERASYQSQVTRQNVDGVASKDMLRGFEEYVHVSKYSIGDMLTSHKVSKALTDMQTLQKTQLLNDEEQIAVGQVVNELQKQNKADTSDRKISPIQKGIGMIGFLNFLGSSAYWVLNATQTYTVTTPYLIAKYGVTSPATLFKAQGTVLNAFARSVASSNRGYEGFKAQLSDADRAIVEELEAQNVIQSTIAAEFGDMLSPNGLNRMRKHALTAPVAKTTELALQVMEKVPEAVEHFNRISTALATYKLSGGDMQATIDAVQATQFNYDTSNRGRLLKELPGGWGGRPLVTPVMMFKTYGVGIAKLLYGSILDIVRKKEGKAEAAKLAAGLIASHTAFGGVAGGIMAAPVLAIQAVMNAMFKEDGDEWDLEQASEAYARELAGDTFANVVRRGLPAAVGVDLSRSINLGNLIWMSNDRLDFTKTGDVKQMAVDTLGGPIASYAANIISSGNQVLEADGTDGWAEFIESTVPVKFIRSISQARRYSNEGLVTGGGVELLKPEEFDSVFTTAFGFQPIQKTTIQDAYYSEQARRERRSSRRGELLSRADKAVLDGDWELLEKTIGKMEAFNMSLPNRPGDSLKYRITRGDMAMLRSRKRTAQREYDKWRITQD